MLVSLHKLKLRAQSDIISRLKQHSALYSSVSLLSKRYLGAQVSWKSEENTGRILTITTLFQELVSCGWYNDLHELILCKEFLTFKSITTSCKPCKFKLYVSVETERLNHTPSPFTLLQLATLQYFLQTDFFVSYCIKFTHSRRGWYLKRYIIFTLILGYINLGCLRLNNKTITRMKPYAGYNKIHISWYQRWTEIQSGIDGIVATQ